VTDTHQTRGRDLALVAVASMAIAVASPLAKSVVGLSPFGIGAGRCGVASIAVLLFAGRSTVRALRGLGAAGLLSVCGVGLLLAAHFALFLEGLAHTSLPAAVALVSLEPLMVVLAGWAFFGLRPSRLELLGIVVAMIGGVVVTRGAGEGEHRLSGDLMVVGAAVLFGLYVMAARGLRDKLPVLPYACAVYGVACAFLLPVAVWLAAGEPAPPRAAILAVAAMGLVPTLVGHTLVQRLSRRVAPSVVALVSPGETVGSLAIGAAALGAWPSPHEWLGAALVLAGATVVALSSTAVASPKAAVSQIDRD
jgi:drug/metabolite transporter (DMT)-like permease